MTIFLCRSPDCLELIIRQNRRIMGAKYYLTDVKSQTGNLVKNAWLPLDDNRVVTHWYLWEGERGWKLRELVPPLTTVCLLVNLTNRTRAETVTRELEAAARTLQLKLCVLNASSQLKLGGLVVGADAFFPGAASGLARA